MKNTTKKKIREGKSVVGTVIQIDHSATLKIMANTGFDFLLIDAQHSPFGPESIYRLIDDLTPTDSEIIVRVLRNDPSLIGHVLDFGADGVIVPLTNTIEDFKSAVAATKYPPDGFRSWGPRKTERYGGDLEYAIRANEEILAWPQIETIEALDNIDDLLEISGVDGIMVGPADLGLSVRQSSSAPTPDAEEMVDRILSKCKEHGVPFGMFTGTMELAKTWLSRGGQIATVSADLGILSQGATKTLKDIHEMLSI